MNMNNLLCTMRSMFSFLLLPLLMVCVFPTNSNAASASLVGTPIIKINNYNLEITYSVNFKGCKGQEVYWGITFYEYPNGPAMTDDDGNTLSIYPDFVYQAPGNSVPHKNRAYPAYDDCYFNDCQLKMALLRFFEQGRKYYFRFGFIMDYLRPKRYPQELVLYDVVRLGQSDWYEFSY